MPRKRSRAERGTRPPKVTPIKRPKRATRYRAQVWDSLANEGQGAYVGVCQVLRIKPAITFESQTEAWSYVARASESLTQVGRGTTIAQIRERWLARKVDANGRPIKDSTHTTNRERTATLSERFGIEPPFAIEAELLAFARESMYAGQREAAKAMFTWAESQDLIYGSPLRKLKTQKGQGNREVFPPLEPELAKLIGTGRDLGSPLKDWIEFASEVGTRPGETDAIWVGDFNEDFTRMRVLRQYNAKVKAITTPKQQAEHWIAVSPRASAIAQVYAVGKGPQEFLFTNLRENHWTPSSRAYHWNALMQAAGFRRRVGTKTLGSGRQVAVLQTDFTPYLATRHYCGWRLVNIFGATEAEVAHQLRHHDGGELVRRIYGKRDRVMAIDRIADLLRTDDAEALA